MNKNTIFYDLLVFIQVLVLLNQAQNFIFSENNFDFVVKENNEITNNIESKINNIENRFLYNAGQDPLWESIIEQIKNGNTTSIIESFMEKIAEIQKSFEVQKFLNKAERNSKKATNEAKRNVTKVSREVDKIIKGYESNANSNKKEYQKHIDESNEAIEAVTQEYVKEIEKSKKNLDNLNKTETRHAEHQINKMEREFNQMSKKLLNDMEREFKKNETEIKKLEREYERILRTAENAKEAETKALRAFEDYKLIEMTPNKEKNLQKYSDRYINESNKASIAVKETKDAKEILKQKIAEFEEYKAKKREEVEKLINAANVELENSKQAVYNEIEILLSDEVQNYNELVSNLKKFDFTKEQTIIAQNQEKIDEINIELEEKIMHELEKVESAKIKAYSAANEIAELSFKIAEDEINQKIKSDL